MTGRNPASPKGRAPTLAALIALPILASPLVGQDACRGWAASCAAVEVRSDAEGERLILFAPNLSAEEGPRASGPGSDRVTIRSAGTEASAQTPAAADDPGYMACDDDRDWQAASRGLDEEAAAECDRPMGALFLLALPASLYVFAPDGDDPTVRAPDDPPPNSPTSSDQNEEDEDDDSDGGSGEGGTFDDDGTSDDDGDESGGTDDDGSDEDPNDGGNAAGNNDSTPGDGGSTGDDGSSGGGGGTDGGNPGPGDPYHPGVADLPPISQVPEPISTTLFGLGLAGYAGLRLRRRGGSSDDGAPTA